MDEFYTHNDTDQEGPFTLEELRHTGIQKDTPVWHEGLSDWTLAGDLPILKDLFTKPTPPPIPQLAKDTAAPPLVTFDNSAVHHAPQNDRQMRWGIIAAIAIVLVCLGAFALLHHSENKPLPVMNTVDTGYHAPVKTLQEIEQEQPAHFLKIVYDVDQNFWHTKYRIHGSITNSATVAAFKDAAVKITYYSASQTELNTQIAVVYDVFPVGQAKVFDMKVDKPAKCASIRMEVVGAKLR